jgi:hypothetical protein
LRALDDDPTPLAFRARLKPAAAAAAIARRVVIGNTPWLAEMALEEGEAKFG